jgi:amino acid transporter
VLFIGLFYALTSWAMITALGTSQAVTRSNEEGAAAFDIVATKFVGSIFVDITSLLLLTSIFAAHLAIQNVSTRYMYSLAVDGILPRYLGRAHPRHKSPARASVTVSAVFLVLTAVLVAAGLTDIEIYTWFAGVASFTIICAMTITSLSAVVYFRKNNHTAVSTWQGTIAPLIAFGSLLVMVYLGIENFPTLIGGSQMLANIMLAVSVAIFVFGVVLAIILRRTKPDVYMRIGRQ